MGKNNIDDNCLINLEMSEKQPSSEPLLNGIDRNGYYRRIFNKYDVNGDGVLNLGEITAMIKCTNKGKCDDDIHLYIVRKMDEIVSKSGQNQVLINYENFVKIAQEAADSEALLGDGMKYEYWRSIFDKYDTDHDDRLDRQELQIMLQNIKHPKCQISPRDVEEIYKKSDENGDFLITFEEFTKIVTKPNLQHIFGNCVKKYLQMVVPQSGIIGSYSDQVTCNPPPVGMLIITLIEIFFFCLDQNIGTNSVQEPEIGPISSTLIYDPHKRHQIWRFVTYIFVHVGTHHLLVNLSIQILLGIPLEMIHKWWRVLAIYFAGALAGSFGTSIIDPGVKLAGASGAVYALVTAHIATIIMNWGQMSHPLVHLFIFVLVTIADIETSIYNRYVLEIDEHIGYVAHIAGAIAGLLVGINIVKNFEILTMERVVWWIATIVYGIAMGVAIVWHLAASDYFPK